MAITNTHQATAVLDALGIRGDSGTRNVAAAAMLLTAGEQLRIARDAARDGCSQQTVDEFIMRATRLANLAATFHGDPDDFWNSDMGRKFDAATGWVLEQAAR